MSNVGWRSICLVAVLSVVFMGIALKHSSAQIPKKHLRELESNFLPAWRQGDNLTVLTSLGKVVHKMTNDQVVELNKLLDDDQMPKSAQILVEARLHLLQQGLEKQLPKPGLRELLLTLDNIDTEIQNVLEEVKVHSEKQEAATGNESFEEYESLIWESHVLEQKLESSITLTEYASFVLKSKERYLKRELEPQQRDILEKDFAGLGVELAETLRDVEERETLVRITRLKFANNTLADSTSLKDRYLATWALETDGRLVHDALTAGQLDFMNPALNDPDLLTQITEQVKEGVELAGEKLIKKSGLLFTGLHWWMRGRYGMGTEAAGFLKSARAVTSDAALFPLYMPEETPVPTSRYSETGTIPEVDRRHNYIWEWEYRKVVPVSTTRTGSRTSRRSTSETQLSRFY